MKKIPILLFAVMMAGSLSAQIESFSESENFVSAYSKPAFNKYDYLQPFEGNLSPRGKNVVNVIGEQLYCKTLANISPTQFLYVLVKDKTGLKLSKIQQGKYYTVKDIIISKEEITRMQEEFNSLPFKSDTLYYNEVNAWAVAQLLDKSQLPKKTKQFIIPKEDILKVFYNKYREWPTEDSFRKNQDIELAIFVLTDDNGDDLYVPMEDKRYEDALVLNVVKSSWPNPISFYPGALAGISNFITVKGFNVIKQLFENQRIIQHRHDVCENKRDIVVCKKIAFKDGQIMAAITDTLSTTLSYLPISGIRKRELTWCQQNDSIIFLKIIAGTGKYIDGNGNYAQATADYCTIHDLDSVEAKIAYEKRMEEQEKLRKDERKKQELIKKYGAKIGQSIADGKACIDMNKEQCKEAMGAPDNITKNTSNLGVIEVWTYSLGYQMFNGLIPITVVTFLDGKVTSVEEYKDNYPF